MHPSTLLLLANESPWTPANIIAGVLSLAASLGVLGFLAVLLVRGLWAKSGEPLVQAAWIAWYTSETQIKARKTEGDQARDAWWGQQTQVDARKKETETTLAAWHVSPEQVILRKKFIYDEIDNHVRRDDGLIHKEIRVGVTAAIAPVTRELEDIKAMLRRRDEDERSDRAENAEFRQEMAANIAHILAVIDMRSDVFHAPTPVVGVQAGRQSRVPLQPMRPGSQGKTPGSPGKTPGSSE